MTSIKTNPASMPLAIVGVGALFPGCAETGDLWKTIVRGIDQMSDVPPNYFLADDYYDPDPLAPLKIYARRGGFIPKVPFDSLSNGVPPATVPMTDTSQLLAMIVAKRVLEDACGIDLGRLDRDRTAVILGVAGGSTLLGSMCSSLQRPIWTKALRESGLPESQVQTVCKAIEAHYTPWTESTFPGLLGNVIAGRVASRFDLGGTNCTVDAACASSLAAIRMAAQELRLGTADLVITGGVDATNDPMMFTCFSKTPALSRTGDCRPFSDDADGTMLGEGVGMFALRRLEDAERDGDAIYAVVSGLGASSDGRAKSIYAPRAEGQVKAIRWAYEEGGCAPADIDLVEAHGTGTAAGDLAEITALKTVFAGRDDGSRCDLGSVKSQIGHTKSAAGAASLYKVTMALHHKVLPPTLKVRRPNPALGLESSAFQLSATARPWIRASDSPRRAGVSSFGFGGSNYHMTVEEYRGPNRPPRIRALPTELILASGRDAGAAVAAARAVQLAAEQPGGFASAAGDSQRRFNPADPVRLAFVVVDAADLADRIDALAPRLGGGQAICVPRAKAAFGREAPGPVGFLFPGQGSQYLGMGADLALAFEAARTVWDEAAADQGAGGVALHRLVFPATAFDEDQTAALTATDAAQPAIGVTSRMMLALLRKAGLRPSAAAGHSFGELSALHCAGVLDAQGFSRAARSRGAFMAEAARVTSGAMLAVFAPAAEVETVLEQIGADVGLANLNAPDQVVLAGTVAAIEAAERRLEQMRIACRRLPVATAFHSPIVAPAAAPFRSVLGDIAVEAPALPVYGCGAAAPYGTDPDEIRDRLARQLAEPVRFVDQIEAMYRDGVTTFVEVGPGATLTELVGRILTGRPHRALALDRRGRNGVTQLWETLGDLALAGYALDFGFAWDLYSKTAPKPVRVNAATLMIDGANYRKPYPPPGGSAALPPPNPETAPVMEATTGHDDPAASAMPAAPEPDPVAPDRRASAGSDANIYAPEVADPPADRFPESSSSGDLMSSRADAERMSAVIEALRLNAEAHAVSQQAMVASQQAMAAAHVAYLRQTQELIGQITGLPIRGVDVPELPALLRMPSLPSAQIVMAAPEPADEARIEAESLQAAVPVSESPSRPVPLSEPVLLLEPANDVTPPAAPSPVLAGMLLAIVADKTGYPKEMLDPEMELEADLGIDSIKRVEIFAALRAAAPDLPEVDPRDLAGLRTLSAILARLGSVADAAPATPATATPAIAALAAVPTTALGPAPAPATPSPALAGMLLAIVADKTGYPKEMLDPEMELEADLGIDSIKRVEILAALRAAAPDLPEVDPRDLAGLRTLSAILARLGSVADAAPAAATPAIAAVAAAPTTAPEPAPAPAAPSPALAGTLLAIVADKTGYPKEMLDPEMELEADLGIDSIKRVEILAALRAAAPDLPEVDPRDLAGLRTLSAILARLGSVADAAPAVATPAAVAAAPTTAPGPAPAPAAPSPALAGTLLAIVADKTGYPTEMLDPEMELEADLGIDSIKRVEILAALRAAAPDLPEVDPRDLAGLRTLSAILARLGSVADAAPAVAALPRIGLTAVPAGVEGRPVLAVGMDVVIAGEGAGLAGPLAAALAKAGCRVVPMERVADAKAVIALHGLDPAPDPDSVARAQLQTFAAARAFAPHAVVRGGSFVTVQDTGGSFGLSGAGTGAWLAGVAGIAKTASCEWPLAAIRAIDIERAGQDAVQIAARLMAELLRAGPLETGLPATGGRVSLAEASLGDPAAGGPAMPERPVLVVSGGARGVVAACLLAMAPLRPRLLLLGRTALPAVPDDLPQDATAAELSRALYDRARGEGRSLTPRQLSAEVAVIAAAREIRATMMRLEAAGAETRYHSLDIADAGAVAGALAAARTEWGRIDGLVHGAGVLADKFIADQTDAQFLQVFRTKVDGLRTLLAATRQDALTRLCLFSSVAGRYGNAGQVAYAAANETLNKVARAEAAQRGDACRVLSLNWGPWDGGMVTDGLREAFARRGVPLIPVSEGAQAFAAEMLGGGRGGAHKVAPVEILLGGRFAPAGQANERAPEAAFAA